MEIRAPPEREGSAEPEIVGTRQRRLADLDQLVMSLFAKGSTTGEISGHLMEVYGASVSKDAVSRITDEIVEEMTSWRSRTGLPAIGSLWMNAWAEFVPFRDSTSRSARELCSTNAIESLNAGFRRSVRARGHFPTEQAR